MNPLTLHIEMQTDALWPAQAHAQHSLKKCNNPRLLWINQRLAADDSNFDAVGRDIGRYGTLLVERCAYVVATGETGAVQEAHAPIGLVDRYGGSGIGSNGGSGRAALINGYYVKGIGRTCLIGKDVDAGHASGGAYLEEAVREAIFGEIIASEFPHGGVNTLAIIATGTQQIWHTPSGVKAETQVLIVRPAFLRPAHFERAAAFLGAAPCSGMLDAARVKSMFDAAATYFTAPEFARLYRSCWLLWAEQLAYGFVHRLSHGGLSTSNMSLSGALVDFGAATALPDWGAAVTVHGYPPAGTELQQLFSALKNCAYYHERFWQPMFADAADAQAFSGAIVGAYRDRLHNEFLRICGLSTKQVISALSEPLRQDIGNAIDILFSIAQRDTYDVLEFTPSRKTALCIQDRFAVTPPAAWQPLNTLLRAAGMQDERRQQAASAQIARERPALYREEMKYRLYPAVEPGQADLESLIRRNVVQARRDSKASLDGGTLIGFAARADFSMALFSMTDDTAIVGVLEWSSGQDAEFARLWKPFADTEAKMIRIVDIGDGYFVPAGVEAKLVECEIVRHEA